MLFSKQEIYKRINKDIESLNKEDIIKLIKSGVFPIMTDYEKSSLLKDTIVILINKNIIVGFADVYYNLKVKGPKLREEPLKKYRVPLKIERW